MLGKGVMGKGAKGSGKGVRSCNHANCGPAIGTRALPPALASLLGESPDSGTLNFDWLTKK